MKFKFILLTVFLILVTTVSAIVSVEDIPFGEGIADLTIPLHGFDWTLDSDDLNDFQNTIINFQGDDYDIHDLIALNTREKWGPSIETSLTSSEDDYESNVFMECARKGIYYFYSFDDPIIPKNTTPTEPLEINFLGKTFFITTINNDNSFTAWVDEVEYTFVDGDPFIGEDSADPEWVWYIKDLYSDQAYTTTIDRNESGINTQGPTIGITYDFVVNDDSDNPPGLGECIILPNNHASICLDNSLTISDDDYLTLTIEYRDNVDLSAVGLSSSEKTIYIHVPGEDRFILDTINTSEIWATFNDGELGIYYRDDEQTPNIVYFGNSLHDSKINYKNTADDLSLDVYYDGIDKIYTRIGVDKDPDMQIYTELLKPFFKIESGEINSLGNTSSLAELDELSWVEGPEGPGNPVSIGKKNEDHRSMYGIIIRDPLANGGSDQVVLQIPSDQVQVNVFVSGDVLVGPLPNPPFMCEAGEVGDIEFTIGEPDEEDNFKPGEDIDVNVKVHNDGVEDMDVKVSAFLYNANNDEIIKEAVSDIVEVNDGDYEIIFFDLEVPLAVDEDDTYFVIIKAYEDGDEDDNCYEDYVEIDIIRDSHDVIITNVVLTPMIANSGETIEFIVDVENIGTTDEDDVTVRIIEEDLGLDLSSLPFDLEPYGETYKNKTLTFEFTLPYNIETGIWYSIGIGVFDEYGDIYARSDDAEKFIALFINDNLLPQTEYDISLNTGLNLFSIPLTQNDTTTEVVINDIQESIEAIYYYENENWKIWRNGFPNNTLTNLEAGKGYYIKLTEPAILHVEGTIGAGEPPMIPIFDVYQGWNLIGYYGTEDVSALTYLNNIDDKYSAIWTLFNSGVQSLQGTFQGLDFSEEMKRTHGYWIYMKEDGTIVPTN